MIRSKSDFNNIIEIYQTASKIIPEIHVNAGTLLAQLGFSEEALACFRCAIEALPENLDAVSQFETICQDLVPRWYYGALNDHRRNVSFREAIQTSVKAGYDSVLNVGAGTGILACYASECLNCKVVYCSEDSTAMCAIASAVFSRNSRTSDTIKLLKVRPTDLNISDTFPQRVSLLVTEDFDSALFGRNILMTLKHAWSELLLPSHYQTDSNIGSAMVIPNKASIYASAIQCEEIRTESFLQLSVIRHLPQLPKLSVYCRTNSIACECNFSSENGIVDEMNNGYFSRRLDISGKTTKLLSDEALILNVNFNDPKQIEQLVEGCFTLEIEIIVKKGGTLDAIGVWFDLDLSDLLVKRSIGNRPNSVRPSWEQAIFPVLPHHFEGSRVVEPGDIIKLKCSLMKEGKQLSVRCVNIVRNSQLCLSSECSSSSSSDLTLPLSPVAIRYLNDSEYHFSLCRTMENAYKYDDCRSVLILSSQPSFLGLQAAIIGFTHVIHVLQNSADIMVLTNFVKSIANTGLFNDSRMPRYILGPYDPENYSALQYDLIISEIIDPDGSLRPRAIEELQSAKLSSASNLKISVPSVIRIFGMFIENDELLEKSVVFKGNNDGTDCSRTCNCIRTCNVHVADFVNLYRTRMCHDINLISTKYRALTEKFLVFQIGLEEESNLSHESSWVKQCSIPVTNTGRLSALVFWYETDLLSKEKIMNYLG